jgi:hypothetical protein
MVVRPEGFEPPDPRIRSRLDNSPPFFYLHRWLQIDLSRPCSIPISLSSLPDPLPGIGYARGRIHRGRASPASQHCPGSSVSGVTLILALSFSSMSWMYPIGLQLTSKPISASPTVLAVTRLGVGE